MLLLVTHRETIFLLVFTTYKVYSYPRISNNIRSFTIFFTRISLFKLSLNNFRMIEFMDLLDNQKEIETQEYCDFRTYLEKKENVKSALTVIHFNIRSINKNFDELMIYLEEANKHMDIIILSETWKVESVSDYSIPGYSTYYNNSTVNQNDGLLVYIKDHISANVEIISITETKLMQISMTIDDIQFGITASYKLPSIDTQTYLIDIRNYISDLKKNNIDIFIGDININIMDEFSGSVNEYLNILAENGYLSYINKPTRVTSNAQSVIDHIFVRKNNVNQNIRLIPALFQTNITDHYPVFLEISGTMRLSSENEITSIARNFTNFNKLYALLVFNITYF